MSKVRPLLPVAFAFLDEVVVGKFLSEGRRPEGKFQVKLNDQPYQVLIMTQDHPEEENALCVRIAVRDPKTGQILRMTLMDPVIYVQKDVSEMQA